MSSYRQEGKDLIIFATADDHKEPSKVVLPEPERQAGLILPNGEINWNCPCLGGMATGPCGLEFREAFSCFHKSEADPKGSDCYNAFKEMHLCMAEYPQVYNKYDDVDDDEIDEKNLDFELTEKEKALISENNVKEQLLQQEKTSSSSKVEEKLPEKKSEGLSEPQKSPKSASGSLKINS